MLNVNAFDLVLVCRFLVHCLLIFSLTFSLNIVYISSQKIRGNIRIASLDFENNVELSSCVEN